MKLREPVPFHRTTRITLAVLLVLSHPLWAATIIVDETTCTLVDAITAANTDTATGGCPAGSGADTIELMTDVTLTEADNDGNGLPVVVTDITIHGGGFTIERDDAAPPFRLLLVSGTLSLNDMTLENGGGWIYPLEGSGGGILNTGDLTLTNSTVSGSYAALGAGIYNSGTATLLNTEVLSNRASTNGLGLGGGIFNYGTLVLDNSTVSGNYAEISGGGIGTSGGVVSLTRSTVSGNTVNSRGSGIRVEGNGSLTLTNSTVSGNGFPGHFPPPGFVFGNINLDAAGNLTLTNSTVLGLRTYIQHTAFASNSIVYCFEGSGITDGGNNFGPSCGAGFADIEPGVDFEEELADNGGPTQTHALLPWSVAIDAAGECGLDTDQRGFPRDDGQCDSGSFEFQGGGDDGGGAVPASSRVGLLILLSIMLTTSAAILRSKSRARHSV